MYRLKYLGAMVPVVSISFGAQGVLYTKPTETKVDLDDAYEVIEKELPHPDLAQKMKVRKVSRFFTDSEISSISHFEAANSSSLGHARRDSSGFKKLDSNWITSYLHTSGLFRKHHSEIIEKIIDAAVDADLRENWGLLRGNKANLRVRVIELHKVQRGGALPELTHHDRGSLVTIDVMCSDSSEFTGGKFCTPEHDGVLKQYTFERGDAMIFPSHKYHCVQPVTSGERRVLVVELWRGEERTCAHRCLHHLGECSFSVERNRLELLTTTAHPEIDPW